MKAKATTLNGVKGWNFKINNKLEVFLPVGYERAKLPFFKKWVEALESGKYRQGRGVLCETKNKNKKYCCLGVLSKIQGRLVNSFDASIYNQEKELDGGLSFDNPNAKALGGYGSTPSGVIIQFQGRRIFQGELAELNDSKVGFRDIAKVIRLIWKA